MGIMDFQHEGKVWEDQDQLKIGKGVGRPGPVEDGEKMLLG